MSKSEEKKENDIEIFNRANKLKLKAGAGLNDGPGKIEQHAIDRADSVVMTMASLYPQEIKNVMSALYKEWNVTKALPEEEDLSVHAQKMSNTANQIKDLAGTFGYVLMSYFGESLRNYILETDLSQEEHFTIVQAHIDVMAVAFRENLKEDDGEAAIELKKVVQEAIDKYQ